MRLKDIAVTGALPVRRFEVQDLSDVVVIAGPNGVGKTRLIAHIVGHLRGGSVSSDVRGHIEATTPGEVELWEGRKVLDMSDPDDMALFRLLLHRNRRRNKWQSSLLNFESDRTVQSLKPLQFSFDMPDPLEEEISWDTTFGYMRDRFQDTVHFIFRLIEAQKQSIAARAIALRREGRDSMRLEFGDPMDPFKRVFQQLLGPKELVDPSARDQRLKFRLDGQEFEFASLSSGEREVVNIAFDFLLRQPEDCIVFFDEPELHLHPELSYRLIQTLQTIGSRNQFVFSTHSADIISASLDRSVVFVQPAGTTPDGGVLNQAVAIREDDETNTALRLLGQSIGIVALGRRIVLIEGEKASLDKHTYGSILDGRFPGLVLVPSGGRQALQMFRTIQEAVLARTIWGVDFFMLADRDSAPPSMTDAEVATRRRFRVLSRYHLENYFLDEQVWALAFAPMEPLGSWLRDAAAIRQRMRALARDTVSYAVALRVSTAYRMNVGSIDMMPANSHRRPPEVIAAALQSSAQAEAARVGAAIDPQQVYDDALAEYSRLSDSIDRDDDAWKVDLPAKSILGQFAAAANLDAARARTLYINTVHDRHTSTFDQIVRIFQDFAS